MTIAYIQSNALRRTALVTAVVLWPVVVSFLALVEAAREFGREFKRQWTQDGGFREDVRDCWRAPRQD